MSAREQINLMLFGGQHEAIIAFVERLEAQIARLEAELAECRARSAA